MEDMTVARRSFVASGRRREGIHRPRQIEKHKRTNARLQADRDECCNRLEQLEHRITAQLQAITELRHGEMMPRNEHLSVDGSSLAHDAPTQASLLGFPPELRAMIYGYAFSELIAPAGPTGYEINSNLLIDIR